MTLIEILIYASLLAVISVVLTLFATQIIRRTTHTEVAAQVLDNAHGAMAAMTHEVRVATGIYTPTTVLGSHPGQLSLATTQQPPSGETDTYVDFYVDSEALYRKRESQVPERITADVVRVTNLTFTHLYQGSSIPAVQITLSVAPKDVASQADSAATLVTTASLRTY